MQTRSERIKKLMTASQVFIKRLKTQITAPRPLPSLQASIFSRMKLLCQNLRNTATFSSEYTIKFVITIIWQLREVPKHAFLKKQNIPLRGLIGHNRSQIHKQMDLKKIYLSQEQKICHGKTKYVVFLAIKIFIEATR